MQIQFTLANIHNKNHGHGFNPRTQFPSQMKGR